MEQSQVESLGNYPSPEPEHWSPTLCCRSNSTTSDAGTQTPRIKARAKLYFEEGASVSASEESLSDAVAKESIWWYITRRNMIHFISGVVSHCEYLQEELQREIDILKEELAKNQKRNWDDCCVVVITERPQTVSGSIFILTMFGQDHLPSLNRLDPGTWPASNILQLSSPTVNALHYHSIEGHSYQLFYHKPQPLLRLANCLMKDVDI